MGDIIEHNFRSPDDNLDETQPADAEAEILHPEFGGSGQKLEQKPDNMPTVMRLIELLETGTPAEKIIKFTETMQKLGDMTAFLSSLQTFSSHETMALRKDLLAGKSFEIMCDEVLASNESDWRTKPSYYRAVSEWFSPENLAQLFPKK